MEQTSQPESPFASWAILELMGHKRLAGYVTEQSLAGSGFIRIDIPELRLPDEIVDAATQFYSPGAVYCITPTTESTARALVARPRPVYEYELTRSRALLAAGVSEEAVAQHDDDMPIEDDLADLSFAPGPIQVVAEWDEQNHPFNDDERGNYVGGQP